MKRASLYILVSALCLCHSCNYLDVDESTGMDQDYVYSYFDEAKKTVTHIYGYLPSDWGSIGGALRESATDNAVHVWSNSAIYGFYDGSWSANNPLDNVWGTYYTAIRAANLFLDTFSLEQFEKFENNSDYAEQIRMAEYYPYEVRFLRAFFYFELIKRYKNVPLVKTVLTTEEVNSLTQKSFEEVVEFIVSECDDVMDKLPVSYASMPFSETGRITRGACMALKSRVLLYAASPLFNGGTDVAAKYERAASAAWDLITMAKTQGWYSIVANEALWGNGNAALNSKQLILERRGANSNSFEINNFPFGFENANTGTCPSQNLIDAFAMSDGSAFDWGNAAQKANPYANRDPRLAQTVLYNGSLWQQQTIETFYNGRNGQPQNGATLTGYYLKKMLDESISLATGNQTSKPHHFILFRYAEILLNYAEAMAEWQGPAYTDDLYTMSAIEAINEVRSRTGMSPVSADITTADFKTLYKNERRVELAFEDHRFWDIRRWMIGPETSKIYGIKITKNGANLTYEKELVQTRVWDNKMYLYPIPATERLKNPNLVQNPGW